MPPKTIATVDEPPAASTTPPAAASVTNASPVSPSTRPISTALRNQPFTPTTLPVGVDDGSPTATPFLAPQLHVFGDGRAAG
jgi:hypothetical protein